MLRGAIAEARAFESWQDYQEALKRAIAPLIEDNCSDALYPVYARVEKSAPSMKKEYVRQVEEAKAQETRERRITKIVEKLSAS